MATHYLPLPLLPQTPLPQHGLNCELNSILSLMERGSLVGNNKVKAGSLLFGPWEQVVRVCPRSLLWSWIQNPDGILVDGQVVETLEILVRFCAKESQGRTRRHQSSFFSLPRATLGFPFHVLTPSLGHVAVSHPLLPHFPPRSQKTPLFSAPDFQQQQFPALSCAPQ